MKEVSIPESGFIRLPAVLSLFPVSKSTWWNGVKLGDFPKPTKLGKRISAWRVEEIRELLKKYESQSQNPNDKPSQA